MLLSPEVVMIRLLLGLVCPPTLSPADPLPMSRSRVVLICALVALAAHDCSSQQHKRNVGGFQPAPVALGKCTTFSGELGVCK